MNLKKCHATLAVPFSVVLLLSLIAQGALPQERPQVIPEENRRVSELREAVDSEIDALSSRLIEMSDWMYHNPESGFLEFEASRLLTEELKEHGFEVEMNVPGLSEDFDRLKLVGGLSADYSGPSGIPTAFKARYKGKTEHPVIGIAVEYDALRGNPPFHGCQHQMQGPTGIGAAIALAKVMEQNNIPGSVWVIGTAAEEVGPPTKAAMAETGYFDGIDVMIRSHGTERSTVRNPGGIAGTHIMQMKYTFNGRSAHAGRPWQGRSALDAVLLFFHAVDMIREHSEPQFRFHGIVSDGGVAPNIVPEMASVTYWVRHLMDATPVGTVSPREAHEMISAKVAELDEMARGAALATGTSVDIDHYGEYRPGVGVGVLSDIAFQYAVDYGGINVSETSRPRTWEETGFGSLAVPGVHVGIGVEGIPPAAGHSQENADISITPEAHRSLVLTSKVMAAVGLRLVMDQDLLEQALAEHERWVEEYNR